MSTVNSNRIHMNVQSLTDLLTGGTTMLNWKIARLLNTTDANPTIGIFLKLTMNAENTVEASIGRLAPNKHSTELYPGPHPIEDVLPENAACHLQPDFGDCQDYIPMFYFDISVKRCLGFAFSGCGGNQNRFYNDKTCAAVCNEAIDNTVD
ncbi:WAP four-disulfide core domain protein 6A-like isoform X2 [Cydia pomonella]|uniref:WAP four-disulfide core domain protein 6A-like isoform X2 n=1 Tax=Cydia pomonella TaxID=82600 RepID=UPI002ADD87B1|nr:WAP four-disulfide core domain protein 6A-like isoform X2 [Cydia pomonella]